MRAQRDPKVPKFGWKRQRSKHGTEFFHYPSDFARLLWLYPLAMGRATTFPGTTIHHSTPDRYLLHFVESGELWHRINNKTVLARSGEACLMDLGQEVVHGATGPHPSSSYWVTFNGKDMERGFSELHADRYPIFAGLNAAAMTRLFGELLRLTEKEDIAYEMRAAGMLTLLLAELYAVRAKDHPPVSLGRGARLYSAPVRKGIDWIVREYVTPYSLNELFQAVGYSRSYYTRLFRKETGVPPVVWLNRYRIEQAQRLLANSDKSIAQIARAVGIADQNYFARLFRRMVGKTARNFRLARREPPSILSSLPAGAANE